MTFRLLRQIVPFVLILSTLLAIGCGGSKSSTGSGAKFAVQTVFNNKKVASLTFAQKSAAESTLGALWDAQRGKHLDTAQASLISKMKGMPEFRSAGTAGDGTTWGLYTDGTSLTILTGDPELYSSSNPAHSARASASSTTISNGKKLKPAGSPEIPKSRIAYLFDALEPFRLTTSASVEASLTAAGYTVVTGTGALSDWLGASRAGLLVNWSHGAVTVNDKTMLPDFYLESSDVPSDSMDATYASQIASGSLCHCLVAVIDDQGNAKSQPRYQFDAKFLTASNLFIDSNSLMFNWACESTENPVFANNLEVNNGLGVYFGWTDSVNGFESNKSILFFIDRVLGLNTYPPVKTPKPAPATWSEAFSEMQSEKRVDTPYSYTASIGSYVEDKRTVNYNAQLTHIALASNLATVIPSIASANRSTLNGADDLELAGYFGSGAGMAAFGGSNINVLSWAPTLVKINLPATNGPVVLTSPFHLISNTFNFNGNIAISPAQAVVAPGSSATFTATPPSGQQGTISYTWTLSGQTAAVLNDGAGHTGATFKTSSASVTLQTTSRDTTDMKVKVEGFATAAGKTSSLGSATANVTAQEGVYVLSGDNGGSFGIDDNLGVWLNGNVITYDPRGTYAGTRGPFSFQAKPGDQLRIQVQDWYGYYASYGNMFITTPAGVTTQIVTAFSTQTSAGNQQVILDKTFTLP